MIHRIAHSALAAFALAIALVVFVRSGRAPATELVWDEGYPDRLLYEMAPTMFFPTGRTSARGNQLDVAFGDGASIKLEIAPDAAAAAALARAWFDEGKGTAAEAGAADGVFTLGSPAPNRMRVQITHVGRASIKVAVPRDDDPAFLLTWIPGLRRAILEEPLAVLRRDRPAVFWTGILVAVAVCIGALVFGARRARVAT